MSWFQLLLNETSENTFVSFPIVHIYVKTVAYVDTTDVAANIAGVLGEKKLQSDFPLPTFIMLAETALPIFKGARGMS